jgi:hypothetical protein
MTAIDIVEWTKIPESPFRVRFKDVVKRYILGIMDNSELDERYFIDRYVYNCAFCKRRNVAYSIKSQSNFNWDREKVCYVYLVKCSSCNYVSMHLSFEDITTYSGGLIFKADIKDIDSKLLYSRPTSFFTMNDDIPREIRDLISEAEEALQFNLLTGASASLRKAIYTLVKREETIITNGTTGWTNYTSSIKGLKTKFDFVSEDLIDTLAEVQGLASNPVHEDAWETWDSKNLRFLIELTKSILNEMYVIPKLKERRKASLSALKQRLNPPKDKG